MSLRFFRCIVLGWLVSAPGLHLMAETKKKPAGEEPAKPSAKMKTPSKAAPKSDPDSKDAGTGGTKKKSKSSIPEPKSGKPAPDAEPAQHSTPGTVGNVAIAPDELVEFHAQPAAVKKLIESGLDLARQNLSYKFGSSDPANGGLDCSGFIYSILRQHGFTQVPRDSSGQYSWVRHTRAFRAVVSRKPDSFELDELLPGDLLFWTGTYATPNDPPISHVMLYLGTEKSTGTKVMIGASDGRTYRSQKRSGVSVFDFLMPRTPLESDPRATFIGYGRIPGLRE